MKERPSQSGPGDVALDFSFCYFSFCFNMKEKVKPLAW